MYIYSSTSLMTYTTSAFTSYLAYFDTIWQYFSTHWWLGILFIIYHILLWHTKTSTDITNYYWSRAVKRQRTVTETAQFLLNFQISKSTLPWIL